MKGYWRKPGQTAEVLLPGGWLRTGDGGSFDADGYLYLHDRLTDMIVTGGENVYPAEVESVLTGHPAGVSFAASLARTASGKLQKQAIRASLSSVAVQWPSQVEVVAATG
jgi:acyl-CoA synthetase (AMP-forming)/AMP-acid ligase II